MAGFLSALSQEGPQFVKFGINSQKFVYLKIFFIAKITQTFDFRDDSPTVRHFRKRKRKFSLQPYMKSRRHAGLQTRFSGFQEFKLLYCSLKKSTLLPFSLYMRPAKSYKFNPRMIFACYAYALNKISSSREREEREVAIISLLADKYAHPSASMKS
jgi:hypothetical protein